MLNFGDCINVITIVLQDLQLNQRIFTYVQHISLYVKIPKLAYSVHSIISNLLMYFVSSFRSVQAEHATVQQGRSIVYHYT